MTTRLQIWNQTESGKAHKKVVRNMMGSGAIVDGFGNICGTF